MDQSTSILIALPFILLILALRIWRGSRSRRLVVERMWIGAALFLLIIGFAVYSPPPPPEPGVYAALAGAVLAGLALGWFRGRMVRISINVETHALTSQSSPLAILFLIALLMARLGLRYLLGSHAQEWHIATAALTDGFLLVYGGMIVGMGFEQWLRARKLLADAVAAKARGETVAAEVSQDHA